MATQPPKISKKGFAPISFFTEVIGELKKVTWPSRQEATRLTIMVLSLSIIIVIFLGLFDMLFARFFSILSNT
ncbi:MAG: preprotein translocase subunit SecE [Dehalococcoidales bacterium]|nr:preprotein translocase subunit SecE [Dehalococcoidales bacterium]